MSDRKGMRGTDAAITRDANDPNLLRVVREFAPRILRIGNISLSGRQYDIRLHRDQFEELRFEVGSPKESGVLNSHGIVFGGVTLFNLMLCGLLHLSDRKFKQSVWISLKAKLIRGIQAGSHVRFEVIDDVDKDQFRVVTVEAKVDGKKKAEANVTVARSDHPNAFSITGFKGMVESLAGMNVDVSLKPTRCEEIWRVFGARPKGGLSNFAHADFKRVERIMQMSACGVTEMSPAKLSACKLNWQLAALCEHAIRIDSIGGDGAYMPPRLPASPRVPEEQEPHFYADKAVTAGVQVEIASLPLPGRIYNFITRPTVMVEGTDFGVPFEVLADDERRIADGNAHMVNYDSASGKPKAIRRRRLPVKARK